MSDAKLLFEVSDFSGLVPTKRYWATSADEATSKYMADHLAAGNEANWGGLIAELCKLQTIATTERIASIGAVYAVECFDDDMPSAETVLAFMAEDLDDLAFRMGVYELSADDRGWLFDKLQACRRELGTFGYAYETAYAALCADLESSIANG